MHSATAWAWPRVRKTKTSEVRKEDWMRSVHLKRWRPKKYSPKDDQLQVVYPTPSHVLSVSTSK